METDGEPDGGEADRSGRIELGRLLKAIESSEVLEKRIPLIKQLEEFSADDLGLILQGLLASWIDCTCSGVSHCTLHKSILQVALKCSDLDITDYLGQFLTLAAKARSWCGKHLQWSAKSIDQSQVVQEEEHNRLCLEINSLSFSISTKLHAIAAKWFTVLRLEMAAREGGQGAEQEECVLNKEDDAFPTLETMAVEVELAPAHLTVGATPRSLAPVLSPPTRKRRRRCTHCASEKSSRWLRGPDGPGTLCNACGQRFYRGRLLLPSKSKKRRRRQGHPWKNRGPSKENGNDLVEAAVHDMEMAPWSLAPLPQEASRRCMHCASEKTRRWRRGPDGPFTLCNACGQRFLKGRLLQSKSKKRHSSSKENSAASDNVNVAALVDALPCGVGASLDAFFDHTFPWVSWEEAGPAQAEEEEEEELEWLSNKDAFPSVETMAVEVEEAPALDAPRARTKGRRRVTATETTSRQANVPLHGDLRAEKKAVRRCTHCATEKTPQWRVGPEGPRTLCNACGVVFRKNGRLLPEYRPANSPAFSPLLHSNTHRRALKMHRQGPEGGHTLCNARGIVFGKNGRLLPEYRPANSPTFSPLLHSNMYYSRNETSATGEVHSELINQPAYGPISSPLQQYYSSLCRVLEEETSAADRLTAEESLEVPLLPERPPADSPALSLVSHRRVRKRRRKSEQETFAAIRATAKARRAERAAATEHTYSGGNLGHQPAAYPHRPKPLATGLASLRQKLAFTL